MASCNDLADPILNGNRSALARAITLVESRRAEDGQAAEELLGKLLPKSGGAIRVGITGAPGVGKSTLIETLGMQLCNAGSKLAVLAVDPSSTVTGGSILGDKTRMDELSRHANAFIRPSPGGGTLGGVAGRTQEAMILCEAAGHDIVLIETIGTGQSEVAVHGMVDFFLVMLSPAAGDELQGIKRGVMELCDAVLVHKADGDLLPAANRTTQQCMLAMRVLHSGDQEPPRVLMGSSLNKEGIPELWQCIEKHITQRKQSGDFQKRRSQQAVAWLNRTVRDTLLDELLASPNAQTEFAAAQQRVANGQQVATAAARDLIRRCQQR
ncbi:MAG: LAO/AO transport system kinase [Planctomycetota bacterium]